MMVILIVEDEFLTREYLGDVLERAGHLVIEATNADEAIEILESRNDIRIIITDVNMPGSMDGLKLAEAVRRRWPPIKVIISTGKNAPRWDQVPKSTQFLPKPYGPNEILAVIGRS
jgi:two-component system, response regulator PdtaR